MRSLVRENGICIVAKNVDYRIRKMDKKLDYIISISPYFTAYYKSIGCKNVIEIPPIMDCIETDIILRYVVFAMWFTLVLLHRRI